MAKRSMVCCVDGGPQDPQARKPGGRVDSSCGPDGRAGDVAHGTRNHGHLVTARHQHARQLEVAGATRFLQRGKGLMNEENVHDLGQVPGAVRPGGGIRWSRRSWRRPRPPHSMITLAACDHRSGKPNHPRVAPSLTAQDFAGSHERGTQRRVNSASGHDRNILTEPPGIRTRRRTPSALCSSLQSPSNRSQCTRRVCRPRLVEGHFILDQPVPDSTDA